MTWKVISGNCKCGAAHSVILGAIPRGENRALKERHAQAAVYPIRHYLDFGAKSFKCICGAVILIGESGLSEVVTESNGA